MTYVLYNPETYERKNGGYLSRVAAEKAAIKDRETTGTIWIIAPWDFWAKAKRAAQHTTA